MSDNEIKELVSLIASSIEGEISQEQFRGLQDILISSPEARKYYYQYLSMNVLLHEANNMILLANEQERYEDFELLNSMLSKEITAPSVELPGPQVPVLLPEVVDAHKPALIFGGRYAKTINKIKIYLSIAAVLIMAIMITNSVLQPVEVATVSQVISPDFSEANVLQDNTRLSISKEAIRLSAGLLELSYDCGATVVIEAPARFYITGSKSLKLSSGSIFVKAPTEDSKGFKVITPESEIVDLGTEFGVRVNFSGVSDVYMAKGKASVIALDKELQKDMQTVVLSAGDAGRVSGGIISSIKVDADEFVRSFNKQSGVVWRGESISIADLLGGGNGLGNGKRTKAIDPASGKIIEWEMTDDRYGDDTYKVVQDSDFIDGVFVPDGGNGPVVVSSQGDKWLGPDTSGSYKYNIASSLCVASDVQEFMKISFESGRSDAMLKASMSGTENVSIIKPLAVKDMNDYNSLLLHSNLGMTVDLNALRNSMAGLNLTHFKSQFGMYENVAVLEEADIGRVSVDVWVLVDGKVKASEMKLQVGKIMDIDVELADSDRFLSLVVTESDDGYAYDWGVFVNPRIELKN